MAERSNATTKKSQEAAQDVTTLQKRGRRRLVGAIALVLLAVIILPMVFDPEPRPSASLVNVRIPSEEGSKFTPKAGVKPAEPEPLPVEKKAEGKGAEPAPAAAPAPEPAAPPPEPVKVDDTPVAKTAPKPVPKPFEKTITREPEKPAEMAVEKAAAKPAEKPAEKAVPAAAGQHYMVQVGAFASAEKVKEITDQLKEARLVHYTESIATAKGAVTRVRLGPFPSKDAAEKARERAKALGLNPANPVVK